MSLNVCEAYATLALKFDEGKARVLRKVMLTAEYRFADTSVEKAKVLLKNINGITISEACKAACCSTATYYKSTKECQEEVIEIKSFPNQLLTNDEENILMEEIHNRQIHSDCMNGKAIRDFAAELYKKRTHSDRSFTREWVRNFIDRHSEVLKKQKCPSLEDLRADIDPNEVDRYFSEVDDVLPKLTDPRLLINMDECGFGRRPDLGKKRSCVFFENCPIVPVWRADNDSHHITWIGAITASCSLLRPMLISPRKTVDQDINQTFVKKFATIVSTEKGYITNTIMAEWIRNILFPHVENVRKENGNPEAPCILLMDGHGTHIHPDIMKEYDIISPYFIIILPPHSSHYSQPCDCSLFGVTKMKFASIRKNPELTKYTAKLQRIKEAIEKSVTDDVIKGSWEKAGFKLTMHEGTVTRVEFSEEFKKWLKIESTHSIIEDIHPERLEEIIDE